MVAQCLYKPEGRDEKERKKRQEKEATGESVKQSTLHLSLGVSGGNRRQAPIDPEPRAGSSIAFGASSVCISIK